MIVSMNEQEVESVIHGRAHPTNGNRAAHERATDSTLAPAKPCYRLTIAALEQGRDPGASMHEFYFNGIDGLTRNALLEPMSAAQIVDLVATAPARALPVIPEDPGAFGLGFGLDPTKLEDAGWTLVFAEDAAQDVREAMQPLIDHRRSAGATVQVLSAKPNEGFGEFMARHGVYPGEIDPELIGYYLLIVGSPAKIAWEFQHHADIEYAVGRLAFDDAEDYARYVSSLIATETASEAVVDERVTFWGPRHDRATEQSHDELLTPLCEGEPATDRRRARPSLASRLDWASSAYLGADATKANFLAALAQRPALLLTASHGVGGFAPGSDRQLAEQGALLSADWGGPGSVGPSDYVSAADISDSLELAGTIAFHFACYGAGTPLRDCFRHREGREPKQLAASAFVAALPKRLLSHPKGAALAVIGHVDRAWGNSLADASGRHIGPFRDTLGHLMTGKPVGYAVKGFNERYAALSNAVASMLQERGYGREVDARELSRAWLGPQRRAKLRRARRSSRALGRRRGAGTARLSAGARRRSLHVLRSTRAQRRPRSRSTCRVGSNARSRPWSWPAGGPRTPRREPGQTPASDRYRSRTSACA